MNIFRKLFRCCNKCEPATVPIQDEVNQQDSIQGDEDIKYCNNTPQYSEAELTIISLLREVLGKIDNGSSHKENELSRDMCSSSDEHIAHQCRDMLDTKDEMQSELNMQSDVISNANCGSYKAIEALCAKIISWEEQKDIISSMSPLDVIYFIIRDCRQILHDLNIPTISDDKKFDISRHEPVDLNGRLPRPGAEIDSFVEEGFELNGNILIRAKVTLK